MNGSFCIELLLISLRIQAMLYNVYQGNNNLVEDIKNKIQRAHHWYGREENDY